MPYIKKDRRVALAAGATTVQNAGELNYELTLLLVRDDLSNTRAAVLVDKLISDYLRAEPLSYQRINDVLGALMGSMFEYNTRRGKSSPLEPTFLQVMRDFYKEVAVPYERRKIEENGDVYPNV